jgi:hypothetical protein
MGWSWHTLDTMVVVPWVMGNDPIPNPIPIAILKSICVLTDAWTFDASTLGNICNSDVVR